MDQGIYPLEQVGDLYNGDFVCIKLQMDKTSKDAEQIKLWYNTASKFAHEYQIDSFPTFSLF